MINIELEQLGNRFYLSIIGHANYAEHDKDIVCAGVSTLALSFAMFAEDQAEEGKANIVADNKQDGAVLLIVDSDDAECMKGAFDMTRTGLKAIAQTYPAYVYLCGLES